MAVVELSFGGLDDGNGIYHSIYDDFYHFTKFSRYGLRVQGQALAQTVGSLVIRLADDDVLPFEFTSLAETVQTYSKSASCRRSSGSSSLRRGN